MPVTNVFAGIATADFDSSLAWYERFMGRPPDLVPREGDAAWQLSDTGWIYVVDDPDRAGRALLTLLVDDLERYVAELAERGIDAGAIDTVPGVVQRVTITDPDGSTITVGEPLG
jgi:catechol 2,3-dioxygenase-like lactoylglutathione lyase family enzyme